jgi:disease resistance protein RPM1
MKKGIGCLKSLQKLYFLEAHHGGINLIEELKKMRELRKLGIRRVRQEYGNALCATIQEMNHLESLNITAIAEDETLDLDFLSTPPPNIRVLNLKVRLTKLPNWIPKLRYLVKLRLGLSNFENYPLDSLKNLPNLLRLNLWDDAFAGESLHFQVGMFPKLRELDLTRLNKLSSVTIEKGALLILDDFKFNNNPRLKVVPQDLKNLENLQYLRFIDMPPELVESIDPNKGGECHWIIKHVPLVLIRQKVGSRYHDYELYRIPSISDV